MKDPEDVVKMTLHGCKIQATCNGFAAVVIAKDEAGSDYLVRSFFTDKAATKGDALVQAIAYAKANDPKEMKAESLRPSDPPEAEKKDTPVKPPKPKKIK